MKNVNYKSLLSQLPLFSVIFYIVSLFLTFDVYCKNQVTPETPLLNIAGLPFLRMEFAAIVFSLAYCIGTIIAMIFKKRLKMILSLSLGICGVLAMFFFVFSVDFMQVLSPTLRVSHVIMTVSRVLAIVAGVSGGFVGAVFFVLSQKAVYRKTIIFSILTAIIFSTFSNLENLQPVLYLLCAILLISSSIANDFSECEIQMHNDDLPPAEKVIAFADLAIFVIMLMTADGVLYVNAGFSQISVALISGLIIICASVFCRKQSVLLSGISLLFGTVAGYIITHYVSQIIAYSGNRVLYKTSYYIWIICIAVLAVLNIFAYTRRKRNEKVCL